jgi:hypothetical protein
MKAICITNRNHDTPERNGGNAILTIGKVYDVKCLYALNSTDEWELERKEYHVTSDAGRNIVVPYYYFKLISEYRKEQIEKILECTTSFA